MKTTLTQEEYSKIKQLVENALSSYNKAEAKKYIDQIQYCAYGLTGNARNILASLEACVKEASGRISDKERKKYFVTMELYKLMDYVSED